MKEILEGLRIEHGVRAPKPAVPMGREVWQRWSRWLGALLVLPLAAGGWAVATRRGLAVEVVAAIPVGNPGSRAPSLTAGGYVKSSKVVYVVPRVSGRISSLLVREGDLVHEGSLIAELDATDLENELAEARANLALAEATLGKLQHGSRPEEIQEQKAKAGAIELAKERAKRELARSTALFDAGFVSAQALDQVRTEFLVAERNHEAARQGLALVAAGPRIEEVQVAEAARAAAKARWVGASNRRGYARVLAPVTGRVLRKIHDVGDLVSPDVPFLEGYDTVAAGSPVVALADLDRLEASADINETEVGRISLGQQVEVTANAFPSEVLHGAVTQISPKADKNKNTVQVKATLEKTSRALSYDMGVKLSFLTPDGPAASAPKGVQVPTRALVEQNGKSYVFVASGDRASLRPVTLGTREKDSVVVTAGVEAGERVIVTGHDALKDGRRIRFQ